MSSVIIGPTTELSRVHVTQAPPPQGRRRSEVGFCSNDLCTPGTGVNLWGVSPLYENLWC